MVTQNVWFQARWMLNAHVVDTDREQPLEQLSGPVAASWNEEPLPWRFCARVVGDQLDVKGWSLGGPEPSEPSWTDAAHAGTFTLPADWVYAGRPGFYVGHVDAGESTQFSDLVTTALPDGMTDPAGGGVVDLRH